MSLNGKEIVVTGGTDGIGKVTARELAKQGARVTIVARNATKGDNVVRELRAQTQSETIFFVEGDLSSRKGVNHAAGLLKERLSKLDVLVNNAGAFFQTRTISADGVEQTLALNHLGYFSMTALLIDVLKAAGSARIVNVASAAHLGAKLNLDDLQNEKRYSGWTAYGQSKLANIYFTYELSRRLEGSTVTANCLHPGFVASAFGDNNGGFMRAAIGFAKSIAAISEDKGARTSVYLASSPDVEKVNGRYFDKCKDVKSSPVSYDENISRQLWAASESLAGLTFK